MWSLPVPQLEGTMEGTTDDNPIVLAGISGIDFARFLWVLYPSVLGSCKATTADEWISILDQADRWQIDGLKFRAVAQLKTLTLDPVVKITLWTRHNLDSNDLAASYAALVTRSESLSLGEAQQLGMETFVKVAKARDVFHSREISDQESSYIQGGINIDANVVAAAIVYDIFHVSRARNCTR